jgi:hypothetical protein
MIDNAKRTAKTLNELSETYIDTHNAVKDTAKTAEKSQKLWREGNKSKLIKIGIACIVFPDPSPIGEIVGAGFLAAGAVQLGIQKRTLYVDDFRKDLVRLQKQLRATQDSLRL